MLKIVFLCLVALIASVSAAKDYKVNGQLITYHKAPFLVQLRRKDKYECSGTLVTPTHVVTSAKCAANYKPEDFQVVGMTFTLTQGVGIRRGVTAIYSHPKHKSALLYDVAVLKLDGPLEGSNIKAVNLCTKNIGVGTQLEFTGWDLMPYGYDSDNVRQKTVTVLPQDLCKKQYNFFEYSDTEMCAEESGTPATCHGNSGGPAIYEGELCGIVSWTQNCGQNGRPLLFTNVNTVKDYIEEQLKK